MSRAYKASFSFRVCLCPDTDGDLEKLGLRMRGISASSSSLSLLPSLKTSRCFVPSLYSNLKPKTLPRFSSLRIQSSSRPGLGSGENDSKSVLDAFFMGKALVETLNVHIEAALGEFTSAFGEWQAEKQKQAQDLQEEVLERARKEKEKAAREVMGEEGAGQKSTTATEAAMAPAVSHVSPGTSNSDPLLSFMKD